MLLKSINYWSMPGGLEGTLDVVEFIRLAKDHCFEAVELAIGESGSLGLDTDEAKCQSILVEAEKIGIQVASVASGLYWNRSLGDEDEQTRSQALDELKKMLQITSWLGCRTLLTIPGSVDVFFMPERQPLAYAHVWRYCQEGLKAAIPTAEACEVRMGIENVWNKFLLSPIEMATFIDQFQSPWVGAYVDVGNVLAFGYPQQWLRTLGKRVVGIHFKDFRKSVGTVDGFVDLLEGDVDWPEVMAAIAEIGYEGPIAAEMIPGYRHHPMVRIANTSNAMDAILS
ncbi:MAG: sugar phosphate isomerase/epimerase [Armatimonadetes bacterium]|nr:sugar phosphate isomerase/epimerase [Armatimonadota bacterium]